MRLSKLVYDLLSTALSRFLILVFGIIKAVIVSRTLGPEGNGIVAALLVYPSLFLTFGSLGIRRSSAFLLGSEKDSESNIIKSILHLWFFSSILSVGVCFLLLRYFSNSGDSLLLVFWALIPIPFALFNGYISGIYIGRKKIREFNAVNWLQSSFILLSTILFLIGLKYSIKGALMGEALGTIFMFVLLNIKENYFKFFNFRVEKKELQKLFSLGLVYSFALLVITLNYRIDTILLDKLSNSYEVGIYTRGASLIQYLWQIPMLMDNIVFTRGMAGNFDAAFSRRVCVLMRLSVLWISVACIFILFWGSEIVELLYGKEFYDSSVIMIYLIPGVIILTVYRVLNMDAASKGNPWLAIQAMTPALIFNIGLNLYFIPAYGAIGAAISSSISYVAATVLYVYLYSKKAQMPFREIFRFSKNDFAFLRSSLRSQKSQDTKINRPEP